MPYCIYLRKSRADSDAEARGEEETLARHERALLELARNRQLDITQIYREVVSGETISARPAMQRLLAEVEDGQWEGVLVMEVERLARGDTIDQGIVSRAFTVSHTRIVTPSKTYDPCNEFDSEYFEFGLFMSRREYQTIRRRLNRGREASVREGKYVGNVPPYGYRRVRLTHEKGFVLEPEPTEAPAIPLIFDWYVHGVPDGEGGTDRIGYSKIAHRLDALHYPTRSGKPWSACSVSDILGNPVYAGYVIWGRRRSVRRIQAGTVVSSRPFSEEYLKVPGRHEPLVGETLFEQAQALMRLNPPRPISAAGTIANSMAGLLVCSLCGRHMVRRPPGDRNPADTVMCPNPHCPTVSAPIALVESRMLYGLEKWARQNCNSAQDGEKEQNLLESLEAQIARLRQEKAACARQRTRIHELLEQGVYTVEVFLERSRALTVKAGKLEQDLTAADAELQAVYARRERKPDLAHIVLETLRTYYSVTSAKARNDLLKEILEKVTYSKTERARRGGNPDTFRLVIRFRDGIDINA